MTQHRTGRAEIDAAVDALALISTLTAEGQQAFDDAQDRRLALGFSARCVESVR